MIKKYSLYKKEITEKINSEHSVWIIAENPNKTETEYLFEEIGIPIAFYNDINDVNERPRVEIEGGWTFVLLRIPIKQNNLKNPYITVPYGIIFKDDIVISICFFENQLTNDFIGYLELKNLEIKNVYELLLRLHISSSIWFSKYLKQINLKIKSAEDILEKSIRNEDLQTLFNIEKALVYFNTSLKSNDILLHKIRRISKDKFNDSLFEDVEIEIKQAIETTKIFSDILSGMMDAYASVISNNLNIIMKRLTSISIILMIPTLIASFYGMNVPNVLENNSYGFLIISAASLIIVIIGSLLFHRKKWF